jgi:hypothetical protein
MNMQAKNRLGWISRTTIVALTTFVLLSNTAFAAPPATQLTTTTAPAAKCNGITRVAKQAREIYLNSCIAERIASDIENVGVFAALASIVGIGTLALPVIGGTTSFVTKYVTKRIRDANRGNRGVIISISWWKISNPLLWAFKSQPQATTPVHPPSQPSTCVYRWTRNLGFGSQGPDVAELQRRLNKTGAHIQVDKIFGKLTKAAVQVFQKNHRLLVDGIVGSKTQAALNKVCS